MVKGLPSGEPSIRRPGREDHNRRDRKSYTYLANFLHVFSVKFSQHPGPTSFPLVPILCRRKLDWGNCCHFRQWWRVVVAAARWLVQAGFYSRYSTHAEGVLAMCTCNPVTGPPIDMNENCYRTCLDGNLTLLHLLNNNGYMANLCTTLKMYIPISWLYLIVIIANDQTDCYYSAYK